MAHRFWHFSLRSVLGSDTDFIFRYALHLQLGYGNLHSLLSIRVRLIGFLRSTPNACASRRPLTTSHMCQSAEAPTGSSDGDEGRRM